MKAAAKRLLQSPLLWRATRSLRRSGCVVLTYHRVGATDGRFPSIPAPTFRAQMRWLRDNCEVIDGRELRTHITRNAGDRRPCVVVTFDDGYRDYYEHAYPILDELGIPAINFLPTRFIDTGEPFWWDLLDTAVAVTPRRQAAAPRSGAMMSIQRREERVAYARLWKAELKQLAAPDRSPLLDEALAAVGMTRETVPVERQVMTWDQVRAVAPLTTLGGHTHNHVLMPFLSGTDLDCETSLCRHRIEAETGLRPPAFAYPSGACSDAAVASVARSGYDLAFTTRPGFNRGDNIRWLALDRVHAPAEVHDLAFLLTGWQYRG